MFLRRQVLGIQHSVSPVHFLEMRCLLSFSSFVPSHNQTCMFVRDSQSGHPDSEHRQRIAPNAARFCAYTSGHRQCGTGWQCQGKGENAEKSSGRTWLADVRSKTKQSENHARMGPSQRRTCERRTACSRHSLAPAPPRADLRLGLHVSDVLSWTV